jgi:hypothetical protein
MHLVSFDPDGKSLRPQPRAQILQSVFLLRDDSNHASACVATLMDVVVEFGQ